MISDDTRKYPQSQPFRGNYQEVLTEERKIKILERLRLKGKVLSSDLTIRLGVSEDTIRRDLKDLSEAGFAQRECTVAALPIGKIPLAIREARKTSRRRKTGHCPSGGLVRKKRSDCLYRRRHDDGTGAALLKQRFKGDFLLLIACPQRSAWPR